MMSPIGMMRMIKLIKKEKYDQYIGLILFFQLFFCVNLSKVEISENFAIVEALLWGYASKVHHITQT